MVGKVNTQISLIQVECRKWRENTECSAANMESHSFMETFITSNGA